jgi:hypothetical protein
MVCSSCRSQLSTFGNKLKCENIGLITEEGSIIFPLAQRQCNKASGGFIFNPSGKLQEGYFRRKLSY